MDREGLDRKRNSIGQTHSVRRICVCVCVPFGVHDGPQSSFLGSVAFSLGLDLIPSSFVYIYFRSACGS
jgi:hypothetical protein